MNYQSILVVNLLKSHIRKTNTSFYIVMALVYAKYGTKYRDWAFYNLT